MASMFSNVLGYLCPKTAAGQDPNGSNAQPPLHRVPSDISVPDNCSDRDDLENAVYGIEDVQDDWQIVRKMSDVSSGDGEEEDEVYLDDGSGEALFALDEDDMEDLQNYQHPQPVRRVPGATTVIGQQYRACPTTTTTRNRWCLAPPPCFTRSAPSPCSTNPLENLLIEHPSMSVYLSPVAATTAATAARRTAALYRSAPPGIMGENLGNTRPPGGHASPARRPAAPEPETSAAVAVSHRVLHSKRKRRVRAQRHAAGGAIQTTTTPPPTVQTTTPGELGVAVGPAADEADKQLQTEEKDARAGRKLLAKNQLQRGNLLPEVTGPKKRAANRDGNYRCLH